MTIENFYLLGSLVGTAGVNEHYDVQVGGTAPADTGHPTPTGWVTHPVATGRSALLNSLSEVAATTTVAPDFSTTLQPAQAPSSTRGDSWRIPLRNGGYSAGTWTISLSVRSVTAAYNGRFRLRWRVWKSSNADGSGATEITTGPIITSATTANLSTAANRDISVTWNAPEILLSNEYLFFQLGIEITQAGSLTGGMDVNLRVNSQSSITTTNFYRTVSLEGASVGATNIAADVRKFFAKTLHAKLGIIESYSMGPRIFARNFNPKVALRAPQISRTSARIVHNKIAIRPQSPKKVFFKNLYVKVGVRPSLRRMYMKPIRQKVGVKLVTPLGIMFLRSSRAKIGIKSSTSILVRLAKRLNLPAYLAGSQGSIEPQPGIYLSNVYGHEVERIPTISRYSVSLNNNRDYTYELNADMLETEVFNPAKDYFKATLDFWNGERWERYPMGLYRGVVPNEECFEHSSFWKVTGASLESIIAEDMVPGFGYSVPPGTWVLAHAKSVLQEYFDIPSEKILFPMHLDRQIVGWRVYDIGQDSASAYWLSIINETFAACAFRRLATDPEGNFVTWILSDPVMRPPDLVYGKYGDNIIDASSAVSIERDSSEFANIVLVTSTDPILPPVVSRAVNDNPNSPSSILPRPAGRGKRVVKTIPLPELVDATAAQIIARNELARRSGVDENLTFNTPPDPRAMYAGLVAQVDLDQSDGSPAVAGKWIYEGVAFDAEPLGLMEHSLTRMSDI